MAIDVHVAGKTQVWFGFNSSISLVGYSRNGVDVIKEGFWQDVPGDENGGEQGPPIEVIWLGEIARVRIELTKFDASVTALIEARMYGATAGTPFDCGTPLFSNSLTGRLLLKNTNAPINFPRAVVKSAIEMGRSTKFSTFVAEFECHKDASGVLHNTSTAGSS